MAKKRYLHALVKDGKTITRKTYVNSVHEYARKHNIVGYKVYRIELPEVKK